MVTITQRCKVPDCERTWTLTNSGSRKLVKGFCRSHYKVHYRKENPHSSIRENMIQRCYNSLNPHYKDYGGRGIKVCERWLGKDGLNNFVTDMGEIPADSTLNRINNNGNYEPKNCEWATRQQQVRNRRLSKNNKSGYVGVYYHANIKKWSGNITYNYKNITAGFYYTFEEAISARLMLESVYQV